MIKAQDILKKIKVYGQDTAGTILITFAIMAPLIIGAAGMALDFSHAYLVQQRLAQAIDAAALAGAATSTDSAAIEQKIRDFFDANYPEEKLGVTFDPVVQVSGNEIRVTGNAQYNTTFLRVIGINEIDVAANTTVQREVQGIEVALVLDNTGSMSTNNNIATLRTAAANFVNILFDRTSNPNYIKIGLVPYSTSVNVGPYGLGLDIDGDAYGSAFVNNPYNRTYDPVYNSSKYDQDWMGCVLASDYPDDTLDHEGPWDMYRYCRDSDDDPYCDLDKYKRARRSPNYNCPDSMVVPLTNDQDFLLSSIETMRANGYTLGNVGMVWGGRLLSPEFPFEEGEAWDSPEWRKAIVMMTDGMNTMHNYYTAYGPTQDHNIRPADLNDRFAEVCQNLKDKGVTIYTVTFAGGVNESTKDYYRDCATSEDQYYDAPSQDDLVNVFETISRELSNLHIKN